MRGKKAKEFRKRAYGLYDAHWEKIRTMEISVLSSETQYKRTKKYGENAARRHYLDSKKSYKEFVSRQ